MCAHGAIKLALLAAAPALRSLTKQVEIGILSPQSYVMMVTKDPPNQPTRWRPKSRAHFMKRWEKMCTVAHGLLIFNELIRRAEEPPD